MNVRDSIAKRVRERLQDYYPGKDYGLKGIERVATKPGSSVYRINLFDSAQSHLEIYAKEYRGGASPNIHEIMDLTAFHNLFLMPRILDYYDDYEGGVLISESVHGDTLTRALFRGILSTNRKNLLECSWKMGWAIGALQNMTPRGVKRVGDLDIYLIREIESEDYFKRILKKDLLTDLRDQAEELRGLKTRVAQCHGDPSPHNIIMKNGQVSLIDYSFQDNATFVDPSLYMVSLELVKNRMVGLSMNHTISLMENNFREAYSQMTKEKYNRPIWSLIKTLNYLHFLLMYATRERTIKNTLVGAVDRWYLLKKVRGYKGDLKW